MQAGNHIPSYLLLERFAKGRIILDMCAPNEQGVDLLLPLAESITLVQGRASDHQTEMKQGLQRIVAQEGDIPFRNGVFDMVLMLNPNVQSEAFVLEESIDMCRNLLSPSGIAAFLFPNVESVAGRGALSKVPDFLDLERLLRRYFPHLMLFAQQPLFGATLSPIGRRVKEDGPLLDDRLLPAEGETPDYFVALGSAKYHRLDDTVIAQLPFLPVAEGYRLKEEKYEGTIHLVQAEKKARDRKIDQLRAQVDELNEKLLQAELEVRDRESLVARIAFLDEQIVRKDAAVAEAVRKASEKSHHQLELEESVHELQRAIRRLEQQIADREQTIELLQKEREDHDQERQALVKDLHLVRSELKGMQRKLDERIEEVASREAELEQLRREGAQLREQLQREREEKRVLETQARQQEDHDAILGALENELNKIRVQAQAERQRLEVQFEEEHRKLLDEITIREDMRRKAHLFELQVKELELELETDKSRAEAQAEDIQALKIRLEMFQTEKKEFQKEKRERDGQLEELQQKLQLASDELGRSKHMIRMVTTRAEEAEERSRELQQRMTDVQTQLNNSEQHCGELQLQVNRLPQLEEKYNNALTKMAQLEESLAVAEGRSRAVAAHRSEHVAELEERYSDAMNQVRELKKTNQELEGQIIELEVDSLRLSQLEKRHRAAMTQVEKLQREAEEYWPIVNSAAVQRQQAESAELKYLEEQTAHQKTRAMLLDARGKVSKMEADLTEEEQAHDQTRQELRETNERIVHLEADLTRAMGMMAERSEGAEQEVHTAAEKVRHLRNELVRLQHENETELLCVREDLETELRHSMRRLEQAQQEIWELREEVIRLKAQSAATAAAAAKKGINEEFQKTLIEQEFQIESVKNERDAIRVENEDLKKSLLNRKKNVRILATLLRREHHDHVLSKSYGTPSRLPDIRRLIESEGGEVEDELDFLDDHAASVSIYESAPPDMAFSDDEVVDAIMESVVVKNESFMHGHEPSTHIHVDELSLENTLLDSAAIKRGRIENLPSIVPEVIDNRPSYDPDAIPHLNLNLGDDTVETSVLEDTDDDEKKSDD
ncbi:MAG: hypothetical protein JXR76_32395 [Deltaproteobacteria bacterium]|nr:hypothetical protein [Deltaproteobacteria bacterium]